MNDFFKCGADLTLADIKPRKKRVTADGHYLTIRNACGNTARQICLTELDTPEKILFHLSQVARKSWFQGDALYDFIAITTNLLKEPIPLYVSLESKRGLPIPLRG